MRSVITLLSFFSFSLAAQTLPPPRYSFGLTFDESRGRLVLFGGYYRGTVFGDTWEWDGTRWETKNQDGGPAGRNGPALVYNSKTKTTLLFGGDANNKPFSDTWEWNGTSWKQLATDGPLARSLHTLAYDAQRDRVVLFGGISGGKILNDLWEWDGMRWKEVSTPSGPDPRFLHASAYDGERKKVLVFGGNTLAGPPTPETVRGDLWSWDGKKWEQLSTGPSARDHTSMIYDQKQKIIILHGGGNSAHGVNDTWEWNGKSWQKLSASSTAPQAGYKLAFDTVKNRVLLFGGFAGPGASNLIYVWSDKQWNVLD